MNEATSRAWTLFAFLRELAASEAPCPSDHALAEQFACTEEQICDAFAFLLAAGMIEWRRIVTICGQSRKIRGETMMAQVANERSEYGHAGERAVNCAILERSKEG